MGPHDRPPLKIKGDTMILSLYAAAFVALLAGVKVRQKIDAKAIGHETYQPEPRSKFDNPELRLR